MPVGNIVANIQNSDEADLVLLLDDTVAFSVSFWSIRRRRELELLGAGHMFLI